MAFPSTFVDVQNAVINKMRLDSTNDLSKVKDWINQAYADVCVQTEAHIISNSFNLTAGTASYDLSSILSNAIIRIKEMYTTPTGGVESLPLEQATLDYILRKRQASGGLSTATGSVTHFAVNGLTNLEFYPTPPNNDQITIWYVALPTALSADADTPIFQEPFASKMLEYGALAEAADFKSDPQESEYRQLYELWKNKFRAHLTRRAGAQPGQFEVHPDYRWPPHDPSVDLRYWR